MEVLKEKSTGCGQQMSAQMDQAGEGVNNHPTLHPLSGEQQPWDHKHGRDHPVADCFPVLLVPKARKKKAGSSAPSIAPSNTYLFPCLC